MPDDDTKRKMITRYPPSEHVRLLRLIDYLEEVAPLAKNRYQIAVATGLVATNLATILEEWVLSGYAVATGSIYKSNERAYVLST
jgi:hypothetical protein